jgi:hypothetical protein
MSKVSLSPIEIMVECNRKDQRHAVENKHKITVFCDQLFLRVNCQDDFSISKLT